MNLISLTPDTFCEFAPQRPDRIPSQERGFFIDNLLVRIHFIIMMIRWTSLAPWEFEFPFPGGFTSTLQSSSKI